MIFIICVITIYITITSDICAQMVSRISNLHKNKLSHLTSSKFVDSRFVKLSDELVIDLEVAFNGTNQETSSENRSADEFKISTKLDQTTSFHHSPYKKRKSISKINKGQSLSPIKGGKISKGKIIVHICIVVSVRLSSFYFGWSKLV